MSRQAWRIKSGIAELLAAPDQDVYAWLRGAVAVPPEYDNPVFAGLRGMCGRQDPNWKT